MEDLYSLGMCEVSKNLRYPIIIEKHENQYVLTSPDFSETVTNPNSLEEGMAI